MVKEIEKKYLVNEIPSDLFPINQKEIHQTYLAIGMEEIRVRKIIKNDSESFTMTIKKGTGLSREEIEFEISKGTYDQLLVNGNKKPLIKTRSKVAIDSKVFDFDIYQNSSIDNLKTIEIEFKSEEEAHNFIKPEWFGEDVTEDKNYKNQSLWKEIQ